MEKVKKDTDTQEQKELLKSLRGEESAFISLQPEIKKAMEESKAGFGIPHDEVVQRFFK